MTTTLELVKFFLREEWKGKHALVSAFLHIFTAVLITYLSLPGLDKALFSSVFWLVVIFTTIQGISKAFIQMRKGNFFFWQQMCTPIEFLSARLITSICLMLAFTLFAFLVFITMHGQLDGGGLDFLLVTIITGIGISSIFTISSSIASKTDNPGVLLPVLSFPVILPVLLIGIKAGKDAADGLGFNAYLPELGLLMLMNTLIIALGLMLIKFIWKE
ncbi:MAG: heme exporter protein CcmB [Bacteroidetes bacterium]|nr:heme exporter protein CcmB [Bacteroidota bacterium]